MVKISKNKEKMCESVCLYLFPNNDNFILKPQNTVPIT